MTRLKLLGYTSLQLLNLTACTVDRMKAERWLRDLPAIKSVRYPIVDVTPTARPRRGFGPMDQDGGDQWDDDEE